MKKIISLSNSLTAVFMFACILSFAFAPVVALGLSFATSLAVGGSGVAYAGLNKEIWLPEIMEGFYGDDTFLTEFRDFTAFVENNTINLAEAGVNPDVLVNNSTYPIPYAQRADVPIALSLDTYDTENTIVHNIETAELSYDKRASVLYGHKQALKMTMMQKGAWAIAPATDSTFTPLLTTTGANNSETGLKRMKYADILRLKKRFDNAEIPATDRILVLSTQHQEDLELEDVERYNKLLEKGTLASFKVYFVADKRLPRYHKTTGVKFAYGAALTANDSFASVAFSKMEMARANGTEDIFLREKDPELRADLFGIQKRALTISIRNKGIAAIYSPANA